MPFDDVPLNGSFRVMAPTKPPIITASANASAAYGCPLPGYQPGVGWVPNAIVSYADPFQFAGEEGWSLIYDAVTKPHLDPLGIEPIPMTPIPTEPEEEPGGTGAGQCDVPTQ